MLRKPYELLSISTAVLIPYYHMCVTSNEKDEHTICNIYSIPEDVRCIIPISDLTISRGVVAVSPSTQISGCLECYKKGLSPKKK